MSLEEVPAVLILAGLAAYIVLAGADFGAGIWHLLAGRGPRSREIRSHAYHAMGPVWEANHVWLIFVLVVCWTAYPEAFGSIFSTLAAALLLAGVGIVLRGAAYAMRGGVAPGRQEAAVDALFAASSVIAPFALGAAIGGIASGRVPVGNARGDLIESWLNPTSLLVGGLAVVVSAYMAAVYLAADASRLGARELEDRFRTRAVGAGVVAGAAAMAGLAVLHGDARSLFDGLTEGAGLGAVLASAAAGAATLALVAMRRFEPARFSAALAVTAIVAGWGIAQSPDILPGLTIEEAAAGHDTLVSLLVGIALGTLILVPSLTLLFGLTLRGRFDPVPDTAVVPGDSGGEAARPAPAQSAPRAGLAAAVLAAAGVPLTMFAEGAGLGLGVAALCLAIALGARSLLTPAALDAPD
jgi:cytochrome bd ubiquinol oxidase subunit II